MNAYRILVKIMERVQTLSIVTNVIVWRDSMAQTVKTVCILFYGNANSCSKSDFVLFSLNG